MYRIQFKGPPLCVGEVYITRFCGNLMPEYRIRVHVITEENIKGDVWRPIKASSDEVILDWNGNAENSSLQKGAFLDPDTIHLDAMDEHGEPIDPTQNIAAWDACFNWDSMERCDAVVSFDSDGWETELVSGTLSDEIIEYLQNSLDGLY